MGGKLFEKKKKKGIRRNRTKKVQRKNLVELILLSLHFKENYVGQRKKHLSVKMLTNRLTGKESTLAKKSRQTIRLAIKHIKKRKKIQNYFGQKKLNFG